MKLFHRIRTRRRRTRAIRATLNRVDPIYGNALRLAGRQA